MFLVFLRANSLTAELPLCYFKRHITQQCVFLCAMGGGGIHLLEVKCERRSLSVDRLQLLLL